jgi:hypothetical protein
MSEKPKLDYGDRDWIQGVSDADQSDNILSVGRATRIINSIEELENKLREVEGLPGKLQKMIEREDRHPIPNRAWGRGKKTGLRTAIIELQAVIRGTER